MQRKIWVEKITTYPEVVSLSKKREKEGEIKKGEQEKGVENKAKGDIKLEKML